jgi:hypothetical protein
LFLLLWDELFGIVYFILPCPNHHKKNAERRVQGDREAAKILKQLLRRYLARLYIQCQKVEEVPALCYFAVLI